MLIKTRSERSHDIAALQTLLAHPAARPSVRADIELEIRKIRAGEKGEDDAAYEIDFHHRASNKWAVIHDLRIEWQGRVAQIDHLLINRWLDIWVCESKSFGQGVSINENGEFVRFHNRSPIGIPSPLEQNRKHIAVLKALLESSAFHLPTRLGVAIKPSYESAVLIANGARITRANPKLPGLDRVVHTDQFRKLIERSIDEASPLAVFGSALKVVSAETLEGFARQLASLHRPISFDWAARFGLAPLDMSAGSTSPGSPVSNESERTEHSGSRVSASTSLPDRSTTPPNVAQEVDTNASPEPAAVVDPHNDRLSTSKLAAARRVSTRQMLSALQAEGYLDPDGESHRLTAKARGAGAVHIEKSRFGPYFLWPVDLPLNTVR